jgi:hypothetical protein
MPGTLQPHRQWQVALRLPVLTTISEVDPVANISAAYL